MGTSRSEWLKLNPSPLPPLPPDGPDGSGGPSTAVEPSAPLGREPGSGNDDIYCGKEGPETAGIAPPMPVKKGEYKIKPS